MWWHQPYPQPHTHISKEVKKELPVRFLLAICTFRKNPEQALSILIERKLKSFFEIRTPSTPKRLELQIRKQRSQVEILSITTAFRPYPVSGAEGKGTSHKANTSTYLLTIKNIYIFS